MATMRATVFRGVNDIRLEEVERPHAGPGDAVIRVTLTTICGTDLHIVSGRYKVRPWDRTDQGPPFWSGDVLAWPNRPRRSARAARRAATGRTSAWFVARGRCDRSS